MCLSILIFIFFYRTNEVQQELHEFRECSEEIEKELEGQLEQNERQMKELKQEKAALTFECDALKVILSFLCKLCFNTTDHFSNPI